MKLREVYLVSETESLDDLNQPTTIKTKSKKVVEFRSISGSEYFAGRKNNLSPQFSFILSAFDYQGEKIVEYNGETFAVYRTYEPDDDRIEIYCQVEGGVTDG